MGQEETTRGVRVLNGMDVGLPRVRLAGTGIGGLEQPVVSTGMTGKMLEEAYLGQADPKQTWRCLGEERMRLSPWDKPGQLQKCLEETAVAPENAQERISGKNEKIPMIGDTN